MRKQLVTDSCVRSIASRISPAKGTAVDFGVTVCKIAQIGMPKEVEGSSEASIEKNQMALDAYIHSDR